MTDFSVRFLPHSEPRWQREVDVIVVGAGAAGLSTALEATRLGLRVAVLDKGGPFGGSTPLAQGGLAAAIGPGDSIESHESDTLLAGAGLSEVLSVRQLVSSASFAVRYLAKMGVKFDKTSLGLEGGHSHHRIVHAGGDAIGVELHRALRRAATSANISFLQQTVAVDAVKNVHGDVVGIVAGVRRNEGDSPLDIGVIMARATVIATGGLGQVFASSTNPIDVTGDGLALCARAGAELTNLEFVQFHPTVLHVKSPVGQSPLLTEALRGAGARIIDDDGEFVMEGRHELGDLAPRDVVAFAMHQRINSPDHERDHLWLDARAIGETRLGREFPTAVTLCRRAGYDLSEIPVPISPGAHYSCGGVRVNRDGTTSVRGLFAVGEVASTGVHGANRLASNSLTEAVLGGQRVAQYLFEALPSVREAVNFVPYVDPPSGLGVDHSRRGVLADSMSANVGVVRDADGLGLMLDTLEVTPVGARGGVNLDLLEATNLHTSSLLVAYAASLRTESRGCHRRSDFPSPRAAWQHPITLRVNQGDLVAHSPEASIQ